MRCIDCVDLDVTATPADIALILLRSRVVNLLDVRGVVEREVRVNAHMARLDAYVARYVPPVSLLDVCRLFTAQL